MSTDPLYTPEALATNKRQIMKEIEDVEFQQWRHHPITAGYLQYLDDLIAYYRTAAADILEAGQFRAGDAHQDSNPDCLRGQIVMLRQIAGLKAQDIRSFYGSEPEEEQE